MSNTLRYALVLSIFALGLGGCAPKSPPAADDLPAPRPQSPRPPARLPNRASR